VIPARKEEEGETMSRTRRSRWIATLRGVAMAVLLGAFMLTLTAVGGAALERAGAQGTISPASQSLAAGGQPAISPQQATVPPTPTPVGTPMPRPPAAP
jgi:hypothetical protein